MSPQSALLAAVKHCAGVPPKSSHAALAAMALAAPTSAWQPPSAPATVAFLVIKYPIAAAFAKALMSSSSLNPCSSCAAKSIAGTTPEEPAVGAATMRPIDAFVSSTAMAYVVARASIGSAMHTLAVPLSVLASSFESAAASPPMSPPIERTGDVMGVVADSRITESTRSK